MWTPISARVASFGCRKFWRYIFKNVPKIGLWLLSLILPKAKTSHSCKNVRPHFNINFFKAFSFLKGLSFRDPFLSEVRFSSLFTFCILFYVFGFLMFFLQYMIAQYQKILLWNLNMTEHISTFMEFKNYSDSPINGQAME